MSYIIKISTVNTPDDSVIEHIILNHQTPQDDVVTEYVDVKIPNGFSIKKVDRVLSNVSKKEPELKDYLNIKTYKFTEKITAKENDEKIKDEQSGKPKPKTG